MQEPMGLLLTLPGLFAIAGGVFNWEWFMNARKARMVVKFLGRNGARIFYCLLGTGITVIGLMIAFGIIESQTA